MPSCEIIGYRFAARIDYRLEQDVQRNRSAVHITGVAIRSQWNVSAVSSCWVKGSITVNGTQAAVLELTNTTSCTFGLAMSSTSCVPPRPFTMSRFGALIT